MLTAIVMCRRVVHDHRDAIGFSAPQRPPRANLRTAALLLAHAVPAALALFFLFPRVQGPLWGLPQDAYSGMTGLSDSMSPGNLSRLAQSDAIAFRAEFERDTPPQPLRYWRGPVMWDFEAAAGRWGRRCCRFHAPRRRQGRYRYGVVLEAHNRNGCSPSKPQPRCPSARATAQMASCSRAPRCARECATTSFPVIAPAGLDSDEEPAALRRALSRPPGFNARTSRWRKKLRAASSSDGEVMTRAIAFLREAATFTRSSRPCLAPTR